jgi:hypothetical protein
LNVLLVVVSVVLCTAAAEFLVRRLDAAEDSGPAARHLDEIPRAPGVERAWFAIDPPPLPNRKPAPPEWNELVRKVEQSGITEGTRRADMFKAWNANFVGDPCQHAYLRGAPGHLFVYDPPSNQKEGDEKRPPYRYLPDATTPIGLVTNVHGFRGPPVPFARQPKTVRIAFIGASTTVGSHFFPYSYPEFIGNWLNLWAETLKLDVRFEVLNAGRESITSSDNVVIVREEVLPLRPDLLVYYEGANQFDLRTVVPAMPKVAAAQPKSITDTKGTQGSLLADLHYEFALVRRVEALLTARDVPEGGGEWTGKDDYKLVWPAGVDERDPDISATARRDLPINLPTILGDLDAIRSASEEAGAELVLASFVWLVKDGMKLNPIRHRSILEYLNQGYAPFRYRDLERLAAFENRVFARYAQAHKLAFIDVARQMPFDPDLFIDAIHNSYPGERLRAWVFFQQLVPIVENHLKSGAWPKKVAALDKTAPVFAPRPITFSCKRRS